LFTDRARLAGVEPEIHALPGLRWAHTAEQVPAPPAAVLPDDLAHDHEPDDPVALLHSSGTTGPPRLVTHTHRSLMAGIRLQLVDHRESPDGVVMIALPQSHLSGISSVGYAVLTGTRTIVGFDHGGAALASAIAEHRPTAVTSFAHTYRELAALDLPGGMVDSVNLWLSTGDAVHRTHIDAILGRRGAGLPPAAFLDRVGSTELGWDIALKPTTLASQRKDRCVGKPVGLADLAVLHEDGTRATTGEAGFLAAKTVTPGDPGFRLTGDIARTDDAGEYFLLDRAADVLELPGATGYSTLMAEVILAEVDGIVDCAVVAGRDGGRTVPVAVVTTRDPRTAPGELLETANDALRRAGHPALGILEIARTEADLPTGMTGAILKRRLREKYGDLPGYLAGADRRDIAAESRRGEFR
jgi:acyl-coenzyme A synthetase/AMP-(fatty) acid ligase